MSTDRAPLTRERIALEALALIDEDGLDKLSMRRLAGRLGVEAMSLYHHVGDKSDLLTAVADVVLGEIAGSTRSDWHDRITDVLSQFRSACLAHPAAMPLVVATGFLTPSALMPVDTLLGALEQAGLDQRQRVHAFRLLLSFTLGAISCELAESGDGAPAGGSTDVDARAAVAAVAPQLTHLQDVAELLWSCDYDADFADGLRQLLGTIEGRATSD